MTKDDDELAAAAIGAMVPTAPPGYFYLVAMMEGRSWAEAWAQTCTVELVLALLGAIAGVLAVRAARGRAPRWTPAAAVVALGLAGLAAAAFAGTRNAGYGEAGILVLVIVVLGSPFGFVVQLVLGTIVVGLARLASAPTRRLGIVLAVAIAHVALKATSTPLVFGVIGALLGARLAVRAGRRGMASAFGALAILALAIEIVRCSGYARTQADGYAIDPF